MKLQMFNEIEIIIAHITYSKLKIFRLSLETKNYVNFKYFSFFCVQLNSKTKRSHRKLDQKIELSYNVIQKKLYKNYGCQV
jgi:hypothetical protein